MGHFPATLVQEIAQATIESGAKEPFLLKLGGLGSSGRLPQHCQSDLLRILPQTRVNEALSQVGVCVAKPPSGFAQVQHEMLLPHELFSMMYTHHRGAFVQRLLGGSEARVGEFWAAMADHPAYRAHPVARRPDHIEKAIPIAVHGDGVPVAGIGKSWSKSMDTYSWCSLLCTGPTSAFLFVIYAMYTKLAVNLPNRNFVEQFFNLLRWSLYWLYLGVWPLRDVRGQPYPEGSELAAKAGKPLAQGYYACLWVLRADLEHMAKAYQFPYWNQANPCGLCQADRAGRPWTDTRPSAAWRDTTWASNAAWRAATPSRHVLFDLPGCGIYLYMPDVMHTLHLGLYQYYIGSVLELMVFLMMPNRPENNMAVVWEMIHAYYKAHNTKSRFSNLRISMFHPPPGKFPVLKGKAAEVRCVVPAIASVFESVMTATDLQHQQILTGLKMAIQMESILDDHADAFRLPRPVAAEYGKCMNTLVRVQTALGNHFHPQGRSLFHFTIKSHYAMHLADMAAFMNPRLAWCYSGEDLMNKIQTLAQAVMRGTSPSMVSAGLMRKYAYALGLYLV